MSDYYTESQMQRIEQAAYDGATLEAGKEWERQRYEFDATEANLAARIAELEAYIDQLIEAGSALEIPGNDFGKNQKWYALVRNWKEVNKEREEWPQNQKCC